MRKTSLFFEETRAARKLVVVDFGFLGDTVHLVPALCALRANYPEAQLHVVTTRVGAEVLKLVDFVEHVWPYALTNPSPPWYQSLEVVRQLRREHFDALFNFSGADRTLYFSVALGVRSQLTQITKRWHFYNPLLSRYWVPRQEHSETIPVYQQRLRMLEAGGLKISQIPFQITLSGSLLEEANEWIYPGAIHLSPNTSSFLKEWTVERWVELVRRTAQAYPEQVMVMTSSKNPREVERVKAIAQGAQCPKLKILPPGLSIAHLAAVVSQCRLHVGCDSGPAHLAWVLGVPTLSLYRKYPDVGAWAPQGERHRQILASCECLSEGKTECDRLQKSLCLERIQAEEVFVKLSEILEDR